MITRFVLPLLIVLAASSCFCQLAGAAPKQCEALAQLSLPNTKITLAQSIAAGKFSPPGATQAALSFLSKLPAFCRVAAEIHPTADSDIKIEVWIPMDTWNGKYRGQGNGGFAGAIGYYQLADAVRLGYATAGTDTGHTGGDAVWAIGHPEKVIDFGYRGIHEMTLKAKIIIQEFAGTKPQRSYFASCSDGGREALMEAQRFPDDYDGIIAGAPANFWTHLLSAGMWVQTNVLDQAGYIPPTKVPAIGDAVLAACDAQDGVKDGIINNPAECHFDPSVLLCKGDDSISCLTAPQVESLKRIYAGAKDSSGRHVFPGYSPGGEAGPGGWAQWLTGAGPRRSFGYFFGNAYFTDMVYEKADWDYKTFNFEEALKLAESKTADALNSVDPNLKAFMSRGGKLIMYHGWSDPGIPPQNTIDYFNSVESRMGQRATAAFMQLYMVPGMQHCGGGPGPDAFGVSGAPIPDDPEHDIYRALERWVEKGVAPSSIIATKFANDNKPVHGIEMTRPLCKYPQIAKYKGAGDTNDAANFVCAPVKR